MLHDMEYSEQEKKEKAQPSLVDEQPKYPYGLKLHLEHEVLKKMGMTDLPAINSKMKLEAIVEVVQVNSEKRKDDIPELRMVLQITGLALEPHEVKEEKKPEDILYGTSES